MEAQAKYIFENLEFDKIENGYFVASHRTLPLFPKIEKLLLCQKEQTEHNKLIYGKYYNTKYLDYVFVNEIVIYFFLTM